MATLAVLVVYAGVVVVFTVLLRRYLKFRRHKAILLKIPAKEPEFLFGNVRQYPGLNDAGLQFNLDQLKERPRMNVVWLGLNVCFVQVSHPETIKVILKTSAPKSRHVYGLVLPWLGEGLLVSNSDRWARSRRLLTPAFHFDILKQYMVVNNRAADILLDKLQSYATRDEYFEAFNNISLYSLDVILQCAFSLESNCQTSGANHPYIQATNELNDLLGKRFLNIYLLNDFIYFLTSDGRRFKSHCDYVHKVAEDIIEKRRTELQQDDPNKTQTDNETRETKKKHMDFLGILLTAKDENDVGMTALEIRNEVDTFLFEGHDTTTSAISWTLYSLAQNPDIQRRLQAEIDDVLRDRESDDILWEDLPRLTYLTMCIKEGMRLHTPVFFVQREALNNLNIDGYDIPAGTVISLHLYNLNHNPLVWQDSKKFDPERFSQENINGRDTYSSLPFSAGTRNCIGQHFAMHEMKTVISRIFRRFSLEVDPDHKVEKKPAAVMKSQNGIRLKAVPRTGIRTHKDTVC